MKTKTEILRWLRANLGNRSTSGLTSTDVQALVTSVNLCNLISYSSAPPELFAAYRAIVDAMQPNMQWLAFHAIACELDWGHREMIWGMSGQILKPAIKCAFEPGGSMRGGAQ